LELPGKYAQRLQKFIAGQDEELWGHMRGIVPIDVAYPDEFEAIPGRPQLAVPRHADCRPGPDWLSVGVRFPRQQLPGVVAALHEAKAVAADGAAPSAEGTTDD
jgi:hypothetical protein